MVAWSIKKILEFRNLCSEKALKGRSPPIILQYSTISEESWSIKKKVCWSIHKQIWKQIKSVN
jgi:hypothetical protein